LLDACSIVFALAVVRDFDRSRFRLIAAERYWLSDPFKFLVQMEFSAGTARHSGSASKFPSAFATP
jgi:hypothetical protein